MGCISGQRIFFEITRRRGRTYVFTMSTRAELQDIRIGMKGIKKQRKGGRAVQLNPLLNRPGRSWRRSSCSASTLMVKALFFSSLVFLHPPPKGEHKAGPYRILASAGAEHIYTTCLSVCVLCVYVSCMSQHGIPDQRSLETQNA